MPLFSFGSKSSHKHHCRVLLLDDSEFTQEITSKTRGFELMNDVFSSLNLYEKDYFGLRFRDIDDKTQWLDPEKTIKKQIYSGPPYTLYFGVKFYAADPTKLKEELTRYQFFLQIKKDMLQGRLPCSFNVAAELCAYEVQSELGDYDETLHTENYVSEFRFVPNQNEQLEQKIGEIHQKLRGHVPSEAEFNFLERVKWLEMYGVDLHPVKGQDNLEYFLGLTPTGIVLFRNRNKIGSFIWPKITKLKFKGHNFILRVNQGKNDEEKEYSFMLETKSAAKQLWKYCAEHHTFFRLEKANDVPASAYNFLFKKGSGFRFSGRTQQEVMEDNMRVKRPPPVVQRVQSKRYTRRISTEESTNVQNHSHGNSKHQINSNTPKKPESNGDVTQKFYSVDGKETSPPWQQRPNSQSGLYTSGHNVSANSYNESAPAGVPVSARFPKPYKTSNAMQSDGEMPKRKISSYHAGYSSGEEAARRKRSHYYSGYTSGASDGEAIVNKMKHRAGSEPNMNYSRVHSNHMNNNSEMVQQSDSFHKHRHGGSRESVATSAYDGRGGRDYRYYPRESGSKSDGEQASRQRRQHVYNRAHRSRGGLSDTEMVPALKVYNQADGPQRIPNGNRPRQHRHHHHHHHRMPRGPIAYDPRNAKVLLELGPETAPPDSENSFGDSTVSSIPEERSLNLTANTTNLNQSTASNQSNGSVQMTRASLHSMNHANQSNHARIVNQQPQYRNHPIQKQARPVSMDMKYVNPGYHYVEHGPRPPNGAPGNRQNHYSVDPIRAKMAGQQQQQQQMNHPNSNQAYPWQVPQGNKSAPASRQQRQQHYQQQQRLQQHQQQQYHNHQHEQQQQQRPQQQQQRQQQQLQQRQQQQLQQQQQHQHHQQQHQQQNRYLQQYVPAHVVHKSQQAEAPTSIINDRKQFVEQVVGPPSKADATPINNDIENELANYSISTEL